MYYEKWQILDPSGSQFLRYNQLSDFVNDLEPPLRIPKPNQLLLVAMDLPICEDDRMHCVDILDGLTKYFLGTFYAPVDVKKDRPKDYHPIITTIQRQRELYLSRMGLKRFKKNVERKKSTIDKLILSNDLKTSTLVPDDNQNHETNLKQ